MKKYEYIDSLRGLAILGVIFVHTSQSVTGLHPLLISICNYGKHGVQLFFFLSAYTLCLSREGRENEIDANRKYFVRRFFRIAPLYYFGIILYGIIYLLKHEEILTSFQVNTEYSAYKVIRHMTFTQSLSPDVIFGVVPGGWSIGTEMLFYLIFPFLYDKISIIRSKYLLILLPLGTVIMSFVFFRSLPHLFPPLSKHDFNFYYCTILNQLPIFLLGISFFVLLSDKVFEKSTGWLFLGLFFLFTGILIFVKHHDHSDISLFPFFASCSFVCLFFAFKTLSFLNTVFIQWIGRISFSVYLFHFIFAWGISNYINAALFGKMNSAAILAICIITTVAGSLLVATLTKLLIEDKGIALGSKIIKRKISTV